MRYLSEEHLELASRFLFLSMAIVVIRQDIQHIEAGKFKIKTHFIKLLEQMEAAALLERKDLRVRMKRENIQVITLHKNDSFSSFLFLCGGREEKRNYFNPAIRKKVEAILDELMLKALVPNQRDTAAEI